MRVSLYQKPQATDHGFGGICGHSESDTARCHLFSRNSQRASPMEKEKKNIETSTRKSSQESRELLPSISNQIPASCVRTVTCLAARLSAARDTRNLCQGSCRRTHTRGKEKREAFPICKILRKTFWCSWGLLCCLGVDQIHPLVSHSLPTLIWKSQHRQ
jgi:hypothetical protein